MVQSKPRCGETCKAGIVTITCDKIKDHKGEHSGPVTWSTRYIKGPYDPEPQAYFDSLNDAREL